MSHRILDPRRPSSRSLPAGLRPARWALAACLLLLAPACDEKSEDDEPAADEYVYDCMNAPATVKVYATDESFRAIVDKESAGAALPNAARAATLLAPSSGTTISATTPPAFSLDIPVSASLPGRPRRTLARRVLQWLSPVGTAYAHCGNVNGNNMLLRLLRSGESRPVYTALLSVNGFTPSAAVWQRVMAGRKGQTLQASLMLAMLVDGRVMEGPFISQQAVTFTVGD
jgi:hypothetical protein